MITGDNISSSSVNVSVKTSQMASWLEESDWICCIRCCSRPCEGRNSLFVSDCGHIYCSICKETVNQCIKCQRTGIKFLLITENVKEHPLVGDFFRDPLELLKRTVKMLEFQQVHMKRDWHHQKQMGMPTLVELRKQYGNLADLPLKDLQSGFNKKMAHLNQEEQKLKTVYNHSKLLFDEIVSLVRQMKRLGWNEQNLAWEENGRIINGVELLKNVATLLSTSASIMQNGGIENKRIASSQRGMVTPQVPNSASRSNMPSNKSHASSSVGSSPSKTKRLLPPPPPPPFPHHLKMVSSQQQPETPQNTGMSPMSWQPYASQNGKGMPPPRLPPTRKLPPPTSLMHQSGRALTPTSLGRHQQQTTPTSVPMVTSYDGANQMEYTSSQLTRMRTPEKSRASPSPKNSIPRVTPIHSQLNTRIRKHSDVRSSSPSPFTTPQGTPSSMKRISIRGPPSGGKMGTTPGGRLTPDSTLYKLIQEKCQTPQNQSPSSLRGHSTSGSGSGGMRSRRVHQHPHSGGRPMSGGRRNMVVSSHYRRPGT